MALNPLVSLFGRLIARSARITDKHTDIHTHTDVTLAAHARRGLEGRKDKHTSDVCVFIYVFSDTYFPLYAVRKSQQTKLKECCLNYRKHVANIIQHNSIILDYSKSMCTLI